MHSSSLRRDLALRRGFAHIDFTKALPWPVLREECALDHGHVEVFDIDRRRI